MEELVEVRAEWFPDARRLIDFVHQSGRMITERDEQMGANVIGFIPRSLLNQFGKENDLVFMNLYPDMSRSQYTKNDTFIYAGPITTEAWTQMQKYARRTSDRIGYLLPGDVDGLQDVIILRSATMSDDDCMTAAAWIRMVDQCTARAYAVPCRAKLSHHVIANATAGAPKELCKMVTLDLFKVEQKEDEDPQTV